MERKLVLTSISVILLTSLLGVTFRVEKVEASGTIYIRADGSIDPPTANITTADNVTYTFIGNINESIVVERNNIVVDGADYTLQGTGSGYGITLSGRSNVTLRNIEINAFYRGIYLYSSSNNAVSGNNITNNGAGVWLDSFSNYNTVSGNSFVDDGLLVDNSFGNMVVDNLVNGKPLVYLEGASDLMVEDAGQVILINCNRIRVETLTLSNAVVGVQLYHTNNTTITGNNITDNQIGVFLTNSSNNTVSENNITNNSASVWLLSSSNNNSISGNIISANSADGIHVSSSSNYNTVSGNNITSNNRYGVYLFETSYNTISGNNITDNSEYGVYLDESFYNTVSGNNITNNGYGVILSSSSDNTISGNSFVDDGLLVDNSFGNMVVDNLVNGKPLVYLEGVSDLMVEDAGQVILINCNRIRVENLNLSNTDAGAQLWNTNNTVITGNNIASNSWFGVFLYYSSYNTVSGNNITDNERGVYLYSSSNYNTFSGNNITSNDDGVVLFSSSDNTIYHNNFVNNPVLLYFFTISMWDNGCEGNFWSDYNGTDSDGDGIGDTPYIIDWYNRDYYPLINPYWNPTDINHDLKVDIFDVVLACVAYSTAPSDLNWNCHSDISEPYGVIDIFDIDMICSSYGEEYTP